MIQMLQTAHRVGTEGFRLESSNSRFGSITNDLHALKNKTVAYVQFSCTIVLFLPHPNDQDALLEKVNNLEEQFNDNDRDIEKFVGEINKSEEDFVDEEGETTELTNYMKRREQRKDDLVGRTYEPRDKALFDENNLRKEKSLFLDLAEKSAKQDIKTIKSIQSQLPHEDLAYDKASEILDKLRDQKAEATRLKEKWHENDLPPIADAQPAQSFPQDSSEIHQTDFNSFDPFGEE